MLLTVTETAQSHFRALLQREEPPGMNIRVFVANPLTMQAEIGVTFCPPGEEEEQDIALFFGDFSLFVDKSSEKALQEARIDFEDTVEGGQLSIKAPYLKGQSPDKDSPLSDRIQYILDGEVNPNLASHGGRVSLVDIQEGGVVILQFGGGCHGCSMVNVTLKQGVEKTLKEKFPEISEIRDATDHAMGENPYFN